MSKSDYSYAPDEFDVPAPEGAPAGVFRAPRSGWTKTWPFLLVAVIFAGLAIGGVAVISGGFGGTPAAEPKPPAVESPADAGAERPGRRHDGRGDPEAETPVDEPVAPEEPVDPAVDVAALLAAADKTALVRVLNDGGPAGMAASGVRRSPTRASRTSRRRTSPMTRGHGQRRLVQR
ncbi:hypothetical protein NKG05_18575 [Oerskovia sp. M15]